MIMKCACRGSFLDRFVQPYILLTLNRERMYGFSVYKKLLESEIMDFSGLDPTGLYRTLKKMELENLLTSKWEIDASAQPKKIYGITGEGRECLRHWKATLTQYRKEIGALVAAVSESLETGEEPAPKTKGKMLL